MRRANRPAALNANDAHPVPEVRMRHLRRRRRPKPGLLLRHHGQLLSSTEGVFHGPFHAKVIGLVLYLFGTLLYQAVRSSTNLYVQPDMISMLLSVASLYFTMAIYPKYAIVAAALAGSGISTRRFAVRFSAFVAALLVTPTLLPSLEKYYSSMVDLDQFTPLGIASTLLAVSLG